MSKISDLPPDDSPITQDESVILDTIFKDNKSTLNTIVDGLKGTIVMGLLLYIILLPQTSSLLSKVFPTSENSVYIRNGLLVLLFVGLYFIITNIHLVRN